jgi:hypothetical protein
MNCEWVRNNGALYMYDELPDDARYELEQHIARCESCAKEVADLRELHAAMSVDQVQEPSPSLLAASRMKFEESLEHAEQSRGSRWVFDLAGWMHQVRFSPALAAVLLMVGFGAGIFTAFRAVPTKQNDTSVAAADITGGAPIAAIRGITQDPQNNTVDISYDKLVPDSAHGSMDDPKIRQLLLYAARANYNSGVRLESIDVLTKKPDDANIREALIFSLRYDKNPGVRLKSLESLRPFVKSDVRVRNVMLEALSRDTCPGVRIEAIRSLTPVIADSSVRETLAGLAAQDNNKFIRSESKRVLASLPEIQ